ncbi:MAG: sulfate permease [Jaaginema sp. PMC 1079.18]|nr:sulfate permease [Jaaginema sp. PMC 1080.18]MEC4852786.1 sulfate permease [Jaaginema sp. PMC 1079.18]MEC4864911.1 sulfate permease [Jaaginema sp. PMC 1078.18]
MVKQNSKLSRYIPILQWGLNYQAADLVGDITAGIIVTSLLIPQSMAYAMLANLPPQMGLYASILPLLLYGIFGSSKGLAVGPAAVDSLIVGVGLLQFGTRDTPEFFLLAISLAMLVGLLQILMGVLRLGFIVNFLSYPVLSGFLNAAALTIILSQLQHIFGVQLPRSENFFIGVYDLLQRLNQINLVALLLGLSSIGLLLGFQNKLAHFLQRRSLNPAVILPITKAGPLVVVILGIFVAWLFKLDQVAGIKVVGEIPQGLPDLALPSFSGEIARELLPLALILSLVGFVECIATAKSLASQQGQDVDANQELIAVGMANLGSSLTGGYPVAGGLSRSVVNFSAGAKTNLSSMITAVLIAITIIFLTPLLYYLPQACLAGMIIVAASQLVKPRIVQSLWQYYKPDAISFFVTFIVVLVAGIEKGILAGVIVAIALYLWQTSQPRIVVVGRIGESEHFRSVKRYEVQTCPHVLAVRVDESLYFANTKALETYLIQAVAQNPEIEHLLLICSGINFIDGSALVTLKKLVTDLAHRNIKFYLAEVKGPVMDGLQRGGFVEYLGSDRVFLSTDCAMKALECV